VWAHELQSRLCDLSMQDQGGRTVLALFPWYEKLHQQTARRFALAEKNETKFLEYQKHTRKIQNWPDLSRKYASAPMTDPREGSFRPPAIFHTLRLDVTCSRRF
jgi:hypothetical protein